MLRGTIRYKNHIYNAYGLDTSSSLSLRLESSRYDSILFMGNEDMIETGDELWERGFNVGMASVSIETKVSTNKETGKKIKAPVNTDLFLRLGAVLRYVKSHCYTRYISGFTGLQLASGEYNPEAVTTYVIPFECEGGTLAEVELKLGNIYNIKIATENIDIDLKDDVFSQSEIMPVFKDGIKKGFKLDSEYLDFEIPSQRIDVSNSVYGLYSSLAEVIEAHPDKELEWLRGKNYQIVRDDNVEEICDYIYNYDDLVYYDTETTGLNINFKSRIGQADQCVGIILSVVDGESFFFPMQMKSITNLCNGDHFYFMEHYIRRILEDKPIVAHNAPFDWKVSYIYGINTNIVEDTLAIYKLTLGQEHTDLSVKLKELARMFLNRDSLELDDLVVGDSWGENDIRFWDLPEELTRLYACADTDNTRGILMYAKQTDLLTRYNAHKVYEIELAFGFAVAYQEFYGHLIDVNNITVLRAEIEKNMTELYSKMRAITGHDFNPNSSPQLLKIMYGELGIPQQISRKTGRPTTDKETIQHLGELTDIEGNTKYPFCKLLLEYRLEEGVRKIIDKFPEMATSDGYLFSGVQQYGTTTGRVSIKDPNYQSYNKPVKKNIIPRPGFYMFDTDYSSVEYRVLGSMSGNKMIKENFYDPDFDYHAYQASRMYRVPYANVTDTLRKAAKGINFGLPYGMGDESLGIRIFGEKTDENTRKASNLRRSYFKGQEDIQVFFDNARNGGVEKGYTETYFGRRRYYDKNKRSIGSIRRQAGNHVIQGSAADIYKLAVGRVFKRICKEGWLGKVMLTGFIHDELLGEVSVDIDPMVWLKTLREEFEVKVVDDDGSPWCPLYMGFGWGRNWNEAKSVEIPIKLQWEFVERYGETGYPDWDGNVAKFCDTVPRLLRDFEIHDCANQLLDEHNQGKEIKPALNKAILGVVKEDIKNYSKCVEDTSLMPKYHLEGLVTDSDGNILNEIPKPSDTQEAIDYFCMLHNVDRSMVDVKNIENIDSSIGQTDLMDDEYNEEEDLALRKEQAILNRIQLLGLYADLETKTVTCLMLPSEWLALVKTHTSPLGTNSIAYRLYFIDFNSNQKYETQVEISTKEMSNVQNIYTTYLSKSARR